MIRMLDFTLIILTILPIHVNINDKENEIDGPMEL